MCSDCRQYSSGQQFRVKLNKKEIKNADILLFPLWAGAMPPAVVTFVNDTRKENITAVVTSLGSTLQQREGFKK